MQQLTAAGNEAVRALAQRYGVSADAVTTLLIAVWDRIKYSAEENFRYQIEVAMMAAGFISRVKEAQTGGVINEEQGQRITRSVAKAIETLFRSALTGTPDGAWLRSDQIFTQRTLEGRVSFGPGSWQHVGFGDDGVWISRA